MVKKIVLIIVGAGCLIYTVIPTPWIPIADDVVTGIGTVISFYQAFKKSQKGKS